MCVKIYVQVSVEVKVKIYVQVSVKVKVKIYVKVNIKWAKCTLRNVLLGTT